MSSSLEKLRKRQGKKRNKSVRCSTPVEEVCKPCSISISTIGTNSSSSMIARRPLRQPAKAEKEQKPAEAKKEQKPSRKKTKTRKNRKKARPKKLVDADSDWLTTQEQTDDEKENEQQSVRSSTKGPALFQDATTPELVREAQHYREVQHFREYHFDSPIRQRGKDAASPVKEDLGVCKPISPLKDLPHFQTRFDSSDEEEDDIPFRRSDLVKTYLGVRGRQKTKREFSIDKAKQWLVNVTLPTTAADILWDEYVRKHPEEMREYIDPQAKRQEELSSGEDRLISSRRKKNKDDKHKAAEEDWFSKEIWIGQDAAAQNMGRVRGYKDNVSKKWFRRFIDPYAFSSTKDAEFKRSITGAPKMGLNEYLKKCKTRKNLDFQTAGPSCSKNEQITKENVVDTRVEQKEKLRRRKPAEDDSSADTEINDITAARALTRELQRYNDLCLYATRLKAKEQKFMSKSVDEISDKKSSVPVNRITRKRAKELDRDDSKKTKMAAGSKPRVKSNEILTDKRYIKVKDHWKIV